MNDYNDNATSACTLTALSVARIVFLSALLNNHFKLNVFLTFYTALLSLIVPGEYVF